MLYFPNSSEGDSSNIFNQYLIALGKTAIKDPTQLLMLLHFLENQDLSKMNFSAEIEGQSLLNHFIQLSYCGHNDEIATRILILLFKRLAPETIKWNQAISTGPLAGMTPLLWLVRSTCNELAARIYQLFTFKEEPFWCWGLNWNASTRQEKSEYSALFQILQAAAKEHPVAQFLLPIALKGNNLNWNVVSYDGAHESTSSCFSLLCVNFAMHPERFPNLNIDLNTINWQDINWLYPIPVAKDKSFSLFHHFVCLTAAGNPWAELVLSTALKKNMPPTAFSFDLSVKFVVDNIEHSLLTLLVNKAAEDVFWAKRVLAQAHQSTTSSEVIFYNFNGLSLILIAYLEAKQWAHRTRLALSQTTFAVSFQHIDWNESYYWRKRKIFAFEYLLLEIACGNFAGNHWLSQILDSNPAEKLRLDTIDWTYKIPFGPFKNLPLIQWLAEMVFACHLFKTLYLTAATNAPLIEWTASCRTQGLRKPLSVAMVETALVRGISVAQLRQNELKDISVDWSLIDIRTKVPLSPTQQVSLFFAFLEDYLREPTQNHPLCKILQPLAFIDVPLYDLISDPCVIFGPYQTQSVLGTLTMLAGQADLIAVKMMSVIDSQNYYSKLKWDALISDSMVCTPIWQIAFYAKEGQSWATLALKKILRCIPVLTPTWSIAVPSHGQSVSAVDLLFGDDREFVLLSLKLSTIVESIKQSSAPYADPNLISLMRNVGNLSLTLGKSFPEAITKTTDCFRLLGNLKEFSDWTQKIPPASNFFEWTHEKLGHLFTEKLHQDNISTIEKDNLLNDHKQFLQRLSTKPSLKRKIEAQFRKAVKKNNPKRLQQVQGALEQPEALPHLPAERRVQFMLSPSHHTTQVALTIGQSQSGELTDEKSRPKPSL